MTGLRILSILALAVVSTPSHAAMTLGENITVSFATVAEGKQVLTRRDEFVRRMSPFDRAARMKVERDVSAEEYLEFVGDNVLAWDDDERQKVTAAFRAVQPELEALDVPFPEQVLLVKTTGHEEGGAAYTRSNAIVFAQPLLEAPAEKLQKTLCHELFHVMSRANPELREKLYSAIGFVECEEVAFPSALQARKITNPDAPRNDHCIRLRIEGREHWAVPILFSRTERYDADRGGEFFDYLQFQFLLVEREDDGPAAKPVDGGQSPRLVGVGQVPGFFEQVGRNTQYIIHPEEILADNFALLVLRARDLPSPEIVEKLAEVLQENSVTDGAASVGEELGEDG